MNEKIALPDEYSVKQDEWSLSPCSACAGSPCCSYLPLAMIRLENRADFLDLALLACYQNILLGLKRNGEWSVYYHAGCGFFDPVTSKCRIHGADSQSLICKSYNAYKCWYKSAFRSAENEEIIFFDFDRLLHWEKMSGFFSNGDSGNHIAWDDLVCAFSGFPLHAAASIRPRHYDFSGHLLSFKASLPESFLFFPPFTKPEKQLHFELIGFRLGFPGVSLALADNSGAYLLSAELDMKLFRRLVGESGPGFHPKHGRFSFQRLDKEKHFYSDLGEQWLVVRLSHLQMLKNMTQFDSFGNVRKLPSLKEILSALRSLSPRRPGRAA